MTRFKKMVEGRGGDRMIRWLTGGRPMRRICFCFTDIVSGKPVYMWEDGYGRPWLAERPWSLFRVAPTYGREIWER